LDWLSALIVEKNNKVHFKLLSEQLKILNSMYTMSSFGGRSPTNRLLSFTTDVALFLGLVMMTQMFLVQNE